MPITIRELLASDTISQAADKINFNFDQLLLNGGGPQGPQGPQGPPGPIGGRGIRGSVWYEDTSTTSPGNNPNTVPPTLTPEDEDNYLQFNGVVWTYDASIPGWVNTGIDLTGPTGPTGASGKFTEYQAVPYNAAGDTTIFPDEMSFSADSVNRGVKSVLIGGLPESPAFTPTFTGTNIVPTSIASQLQMPDISMMVHQFSASGRGIVFHGGDVTENFEQVAATELSSIGISNDDLMVISVPKAPTLSSVPAELDGFRVLTQSRNQHFQAGKRIWLQAGTSSTQYGAGDRASVLIETDRNNAFIPDPTIELRVDDTAGPGYDAELRLGGSGTTPGTSSKQGDFWVEAGLIDILSSNSTTVNSGQGIIMDAVNNITVTSSSGDISLSASSGGLSSTSQTVDVDATDSIDIEATNDIAVTSSTGDISLSAVSGELSSTSQTVDVNATASIDIEAGTDIDINAVAGNVNISTGTGTGGNVNITTNNSTSGITLETQASASGITLETQAAASGITLQTQAFSNIIIDSGSRLLVDAADFIDIDGSTFIDIDADSYIDIESATSVVRLTAGANIDINAYTVISLDANNNIDIRSANGSIDIEADLNITLTSDNNIILEHGSGDEILIQPAGGGPIVNLKPASGSSNSSINIFHDAGGGNSNLLLRSAISGEGQIVASIGMSLRLSSGNTPGDDVFINADDINLDAQTDVNIQAETGVTPASGTNFQPRFDVDASIDVDGHTVTYTAVTDEKIFGSGTMTRTGTTQGGDITMNWIRVGNIVTCTGVVTGNTGNPIQPAVSLVPIRGGSITNVYGVWNGGGGNDAGRVEIYSSTEIEFLDNPDEIGFYFSFSYRIQ